MSKALTVWSKLLQRRAFNTWRWWASYNRAKRRMVARALGHNRKLQLREVLRAWRGVVAYHKPLRAAVALMQGKVRDGRAWWGLGSDVPMYAGMCAVPGCQFGAC
jgi:hypothetical protein